MAGAAVTRDETIALFLQCEKARKIAYERSFSETSDSDFSWTVAHQAAKEVWNGWANDILSQKAILQRQGAWILLPRMTWESRLDWRKRQTPEMQAWLDLSRVSFSSCQLSQASPNRRAYKNYEILKNFNSTDAISSPEIQGSAGWLDFRDYIFPEEADFTDVQFLGVAAFIGAVFKGHTWFRNTEFGQARFVNAVFEGDTWFR